jgi:hypothetical protein
LIVTEVGAGAGAAYAAWPGVKDRPAIRNPARSPSRRLTLRTIADLLAPFVRGFDADDALVTGG